MTNPYKLSKTACLSPKGIPGVANLWPELTEGALIDLLMQSPKILASLNALLMEVNNDLMIKQIFPSSYKFTLFPPEQLQGNHLSLFLTAPPSPA